MPVCGLSLFLVVPWLGLWPANVTFRERSGSVVRVLDLRQRGMQVLSSPASLINVTFPGHAHLAFFSR